MYFRFGAYSLENDNLWAPRSLPWAAGLFEVVLGVLIHNGKAAANAIIGIVLIS